MADERDRLVRRVFPELRRRCLTYQVSICEIDLRWGITAEAARRGDVLRLCLAEIDRCYPLFIAMLGERYGWVDPNAAEKLAVLAPHLLPYADRSVTELEIRHAVLNRPVEHSEPPICFFYFRAQGPSASPTDTNMEQLKLAALKRDIVAAGHTVQGAYADAEALGERVLEDLWSIVIARADAKQPARTWRSLLSPRVPGFLERRTTLRRVEDALAGRLPVLLQGQAGAGKTTLVSHWIRERIVGGEAAILRLRPSWRRRLRSWLARQDVVVQAAAVMFFSSSIDSAIGKSDQTWPLVAVSILKQLRTLARIDESIPTTIAALPGTLGRWLAMAAREQPIVLVLDGLEEVLGAGAVLDWLPRELPTGVTLFLSANSEAFAAQLHHHGWSRIPLHPLSRREREALTRQYLAAYGKQLSTQQQRAVLALSPRPTRFIFAPCSTRCVKPGVSRP